MVMAMYLWTKTCQRVKRNPQTKKPGDLSEYNLDNYDDDGDNEAELGPFTNIKGLTYYRNNEEDPYITLKDVSSTIAPSYPHFYPLYRSFDRITRTRMNEKSSKFYPQTTS
jgi:hypothetical protein